MGELTLALRWVDLDYRFKYSLGVWVTGYGAGGGNVWSRITRLGAGIFDPGQNYSLIAGPASILAVGLAKTWSVIGFPETTGGSISAFLLTIMGITILHLVLRFSGKISADLFDKRFQVMGNPKISIIMIILLALIIILFGVWQSLWVLFAGANQLLAAIVLLLASSWLVKNGKPHWWTLIPSVILFLTAMAALFYSAIYQALYRHGIMGQLNNPSSILGNIFTIIIGFFFMIVGAYLFSKGFMELNRSLSNRVEPVQS